MTSLRNTFFQTFRPVFVAVLTLSFAAPELQCFSISKVIDLFSSTTILFNDAAPQEHNSCDDHIIEKVTLVPLLSGAASYAPAKTAFDTSADLHLNALVRFQNALAFKSKLYINTYQSRTAKHVFTKIIETTVILV